MNNKAGTLIIIILLTIGIIIGFFVAQIFKNNPDSKNLCKKIKNFDKIVDMRVDRYKNFDIDIIVEGHFHQGMCVDKDKFYLNLPAFICNQSFFIVELKKKEFFSKARVKE